MILIGSGGPTLEFMESYEDNIIARMRSEDVAATEYWAATAKRGVDEDKASLKSNRATRPAFFFDRSKGLAFAAQLKDGTFNGRVNTPTSARRTRTESSAVRQPNKLLHATRETRAPGH